MIALFLFILVGLPLPAQAETRAITFPVVGDVSYTDDFGAPRSGHTHEGNDLLGEKMMPLLAAVDGTVRYVAYPEPDYGYYVAIEDSDGYRYNYVHINNDTPGTDDGNGGAYYAYAPYIDDGASVVAGQLIGWMGDSGNAESSVPHLHFEIRQPDDTAIDPYESLQAAPHLSAAVETPIQEGEILPFDQFTGGTSIAVGHFTSSDTETVVGGAGPGGGPNVRVVNSSGTALVGFFAFPADFAGGVDVAAGDVNAKGQDEIIVAAGPGRKPQVRIFNHNGVRVRGFLAYDETMTSGVRVTAADLDGDGKTEIITGTMSGAAPEVRIFSPRGKLLTSFMAYDETFTGGIDVAATTTRIVVGKGPGSKPKVRVFNTAGEKLKSFLAYDKTFRGGVRVSVGENIITAPASDGSGDFRMFSVGGTAVDTTTDFEDWWRGGFDVAAGEDNIWVSTGSGGRRASIRTEF